MNIKFGDTTVELPSDERKAARYMADMISNNGYLPDSEERVSWSSFVETISPKNKDAVASSEITPLLQKSMEIMIREPVEPMLSITPLFTRVQAEGMSTQVLAGAIGAVYASDVQENGTYPEVNFQIGGAVSTAYIGKSGIAASFTDEALRYSTYDIMAMNLKLMGNALARHKEQKAAAFLKSLGTSLFDNVSPATSLYGVCTGKGIAGSGATNPGTIVSNGSLRMEDLMRGMAHMAEEGFAADTLLMHPLFYYAFIQDPVMRAMMLNHGGSQYFNPYSGNPGPQNPWSQGAMGGMGPSNGRQIVPGGNPAGTAATPLAGRSQVATSQPNLPGYFPFGLRVVVSPLCPFDPEMNIGDIFLLSSGNVGFYLVDEEPTTVEWRDESTEVAKVKIRERYGFAVAHEGQGIGVFKNVKAAPNYWDGTIEFASANLPATPATGPVTLS